MIDVKLALSQLIGLKLGNNPGSISINNLNLKIKLNRDILEILKIIGPGNLYDYLKELFKCVVVRAHGSAV